MDLSLPRRAVRRPVIMEHSCCNNPELERTLAYTDGPATATRDGNARFSYYHPEMYSAKYRTEAVTLHKTERLSQEHWEADIRL